MKYRLIVVFLAGAAALTCGAQTMPSQTQIAEQQKAAAEAMKLLAPPAAQPLKALAGSANNAPVMTKQDFQLLARPGAATAAQAQPKSQADLMLFVSLSMPDQMLMAYAEQAKRFGAVLMLRGFVNDKLSQTRAALSKLNAAGAQWEISPEPFTTFKINQVPALVMATADSASALEDGCARPETYSVVFGDASIKDGLDRMALRAQPQIAAMAKARLDEDRRRGAKE